MISRIPVVFAFAALLAGCGVGSVAPLVTDADLVAAPGLVGTWQDDRGRESAVITAIGPSSYRIDYRDEEGKTGVFRARSGRLGSLHVLDLQPEEPTPAASDVYRSLVLRAHGMMVVDSVRQVLAFHLVRGDSLRNYLQRQPQAVAHAMIGNSVLLTAPSAATREFLTEFLRRSGALDKADVWHRRP